MQALGRTDDEGADGAEEIGDGDDANDEGEVRPAPRHDPLPQQPRQRQRSQPEHQENRALAEPGTSAATLRRLMEERDAALAELQKLKDDALRQSKQKKRQAAGDARPKKRKKPTAPAAAPAASAAPAPPAKEPTRQKQQKRSTKKAKRVTDHRQLIDIARRHIQKRKRVIGD